MRIAITTTQVPFTFGGAEQHASGLREALARAGHSAEIVTMPFRFGPASAVRSSMRTWADEDFDQLTGHSPDRVICLKFPSYYLRHSHKVVWLLHQHRAAYDLWGTAFDGGLSASPDGGCLRDEIAEQDRKVLGDCRALFANSARVAERLQRYNGLAAAPLYHPPPLAEHHYTAEAEPFIFFPSRLEALKRQDLLIEAMSRVRSPVVALLAGEGGYRDTLERQIDELGLGRRVRLLGYVAADEMLTYYARSLAVFFGPYDEDYGYVTLEASLSGKPLITCRDSGGPLEFVSSGETGFVVEPEAAAIAEAIDSLFEDRERAARMGRAARQLYESLQISWDSVVAQLLEV